MTVHISLANATPEQIRAEAGHQLDSIAHRASVCAGQSVALKISYELVPQPPNFESAVREDHWQNTLPDRTRPNQDSSYRRLGFVHSRDLIPVEHQSLPIMPVVLASLLYDIPEQCTHSDSANKLSKSQIDKFKSNWKKDRKSAAEKLRLQIEQRQYTANKMPGGRKYIVDVRGFPNDIQQKLICMQRRNP